MGKKMFSIQREETMRQALVNIAQMAERDGAIAVEAKIIAQEALGKCFPKLYAKVTEEAAQ
jgi:C4-dicarboxylate-specific signal transduction histidine kinase